MSGLGLRLEAPWTYGKMFSHCRSNFPWAGATRGRLGDQGMRELEPDQVIAIGVGYAQSSGAQITGGLGQRTGNRQRGAGDLQQNLRGERQRTAHRDQGSARRDVQRRGKLKQLFAFFVTATNKHRYGNGETRPLSALWFRIFTLQSDPYRLEISLSYRTLGAKPAGLRLSFRARNSQDFG